MAQSRGNAAFFVLLLMIIVDGRFDERLLDREITRQHLQEYGPSFRIELQIRAAESRRLKAMDTSTRLQTVAHCSRTCGSATASSDTGRPMFWRQRQLRRANWPRGSRAPGRKVMGYPDASCHSSNSRPRLRPQCWFFLRQTSLIT